MPCAVNASGCRNKHNAYFYRTWLAPIEVASRLESNSRSLFAFPFGKFKE